MMIIKDLISAKDGSEIIISFYAHASVSIEWKGIYIYVDPVGERYNIDYSNEHKADIILLTHHHSDHIDPITIKHLLKENTKVYASKKCAEQIACNVLYPYQRVKFESIDLLAIPAYNITPEHLCFHPKNDEGLGYVLSVGGTNIYFAGDTEDNVDVLSLKDIDIAFLPVNQPYTMTCQQICNVIKSIKPTILYPYHTSSNMGETDVTPLCELLHDICDVRIRNMK